MALDAIAEFAFRTIGYVIVDLVIVGIFYWPGWLILRVITLGRYPPSQSVPHNRELVAGAAFVAFLVALTFYFSG